MKRYLLFPFFFTVFLTSVIQTDLHAQSVSVKPSRAVPGQILTVSFTGAGGVTFSQYSSSCSNQIYEVNTGNTYFQRAGSSERIYPEQIFYISQGASYFQASFKVPPTSLLGQYDLMINNSSCLLSSGAALAIEQSPIVVPNPSEAEQGTSLSVSFTALDGATFSYFTETCDSKKFKINFNSVYFQQFSTSTTIRGFVTDFEEGSSTLNAIFNIPEWVNPSSYAVVVQGKECAIVSTASFTVKPKPRVSLNPSYGVLGRTVKINFSGEQGARFSKTIEDCGSTIFKVDLENMYLYQGNNLIYPASLDLQGTVASSFEATFIIPDDANMYSYGFKINSGGCQLNTWDVFYVQPKPSMVASTNFTKQGQKLGVRFSGINGARFTQFTESCDDNLFKVNTNTIYFEQFSSTARIYPTSITNYSYSNSFLAEFDIPEEANVSSYNAVIENTGCGINVPNAIYINPKPSFLTYPSSAKQGETLKVTFNGVNGATFSQFTETCYSDIYRATPGSVYMQQFSSTTRVFASSINLAGSVNGTFEANFTIPSTVPAGEYDLYVNNWGDCSLKSLSPFTVTAVEIVCTNPEKPKITLKDLVLTSNGFSGNQWYLNGIVIDGATASTYTIKEAGAYTVTVQGGGDCISDPSDPIVITGLPEKEKINFYPNPVGDELTVTFKNTGVSEVTIYDVLGRVKEKVLTSGNLLRVNTSSYGTGNYIIQVRQGDAIFRQHFIKE